MPPSWKLHQGLEHKRQNKERIEAQIPAVLTVCRVVYCVSCFRASCGSSFVCRVSVCRAMRVCVALHTAVHVQGVKDKRAKKLRAGRVSRQSICIVD